MATRVYTSLDTDVEHALATARQAGLVSAKASASRALRALALYADEQLREAAELEERIAAYAALAEDQERSTAIRSSVDAAVEAGVL